jgi:nucleolar protein 56
LKDQVEERLNFLASGTKPRKNKDAMTEVLEELKSEGLYYQSAKVETKEKKTKEKAKKVVVVESSSEESESSEDEKKKKKKKREEKEKEKS